MLKAASLALLACALILPLSGCLNDGGTEIPNEIHGSLYVQGGAVAGGADVTLYPVDYVPGSDTTTPAPKISAQTDASGRYVFKNVPAGRYNMLSSKGGLYAFRDSVTLAKKSVSVPADTLKSPGSFTGTIQLQPQHDPRTATVQVLGTQYYTNVGADGKFTLTQLAEGTYRLQILTIVPQYVPLFVQISIRAGHNDTLAAPLTPFYSGIPVVTGVAAESRPDGTVFVHWHKPDYGMIQGFRIYRDSASSLSSGTLIAAAAATDTSFIDSLYDPVYGHAPRAGQYAFLDSVPRDYKYQVRIYALSNQTGPVFGAAAVTAKSPFLQAVTNRWHQAAAHGPFSARSGQVVVAFLDRLWLLGGTSSPANRDEWSSADGISWQKAADTLPFPNRGLRAAVFQNKLWVMSDDYVSANSLWNTADGIHWSKVSDSLSFPSVKNDGNASLSRWGYALLVFNDRLWVLGGGKTHIGRLVADGVSYSSADGTNWSGAYSTATDDDGTRDALWLESTQAAAVFANKMWVGGGGGDDGVSFSRKIQNSADAAGWITAAGNPPFLPRHGQTVAAHDGKLWLTGGAQAAVSSAQFSERITNEIWSSADGVAWTLTDGHAPFQARTGHAAVSFKGRLWIIGGSDGGGNPMNDVWYYE